MLQEYITKSRQPQRTEGMVSDRVDEHKRYEHLLSTMYQPLSLKIPTSPQSVKKNFLGGPRCWCFVWFLRSFFAFLKESGEQTKKMHQQLYPKKHGGFPQYCCFNVGKISSQTKTCGEVLRHARHIFVDTTCASRNRSVKRGVTWMINQLKWLRTSDVHSVS